jgi:hypothetical protein
MYRIERFKVFLRQGKTVNVPGLDTVDLEAAREYAGYIFEKYGIVVNIANDIQHVEMRFVEVPKGLGYDVRDKLLAMGYSADVHTYASAYEKDRIGTNAHGRDVVGIVKLLEKKRS